MRTNVERGEFPYELIDGPVESRYLTWVRNHSNYMAERGFLDYMRIVAILIRGIFINFLTLVPWLMLGGVLLGVLYNPMLDDWRAQLQARGAAVSAAAAGEESGSGAEPVNRLFLTRDVTPGRLPGVAEADKDAPSSLLWIGTGRWVWWAQEHLGTSPPYLLTPWVAVLALIWYFLFPIVIRIFKVMSHNKSLETGSESSVKTRDGFERSFGGFLLAVLAMALIESLPLLVHYFHAFKEGQGLFAGVAGGTSILAMAAAGKLISMLGKAKQKIAMLLVGLLGLMLPLLVILYVTDYLVYGSAGYPFGPSWLLIIPGLLAAGILVVLILGTFKKTLKRTGWVWKLLLWILLPFVILVVLHSQALLEPSLIAVLAIAIQLYLFCSLAVDVNLTSVHGLYRDRLASAYLVGEDTRGDVDIEEDIDLHDICTYEARSKSPYHLVNVAHNLQGSGDIGIRERNSDFFIFSRRFVGSHRTGYCRSDSIERVYPQIDLATAMAISAAAAAPNMGTNTSLLMTALLTLLNVRLGYWVPNPGLLEADLARHAEKKSEKESKEERKRREKESEEERKRREKESALRKRMIAAAAADRPVAERLRCKDLGYHFDEVFKEELEDIQKRWRNVYADPDGSIPDSDKERLGRLERLRGKPAGDGPSPDHGLIGIGFSGGGIRSATVNMGITQALHRAGIFDHIDYMSTVSGGGYLGSSISTLMRFKELPYSQIRGRAEKVPTAKTGLMAVRVTCAGCADKGGTGCKDCCEECRGEGDSRSRGAADRRASGQSDEGLLAGCECSDRPTCRPVRIHEYLDGAVLAPKVKDPDAKKEVQDGEVQKDKPVERGEPLIVHQLERGDLRDRFQWRVRPSALAREMLGQLNETDKWVNLSDGGHIENLATIELLRRRCRFIFIGDGEADADLHFGSLATLIRYARIDLGIRIEIDPREIRLEDPAVSLLSSGGKPLDAATGAPGPRKSRNHFAVGRIWYPKLEGKGFEKTPGHLIYLKSSFTGDEEEVIQQYRNTCTDFPHESTADQFFDEGQFEAYRSLGQHIGEKVLTFAPGGANAFEPAPDGSRKAVNIYGEWARANSGQGDRDAGRAQHRQPEVCDFFQQWCDTLEAKHPTPWRKGSQASAEERPAAF